MKRSHHLVQLALQSLGEWLLMSINLTFKRNLQCIKPKRETNVLVQRPGKRIHKRRNDVPEKSMLEEEAKMFPPKFETTMLLHKEVPRSDT
ncbi:hypothetical protein C0J52_16086 [Blattella germanica]|nr:hypothetical protein C0J52_16086 [Blattella germanica]